MILFCSVNLWRCFVSYFKTFTFLFELIENNRQVRVTWRIRNESVLIKIDKILFGFVLTYIIALICIFIQMCLKSTIFTGNPFFLYDALMMGIIFCHVNWCLSVLFFIGWTKAKKRFFQSGEQYSKKFICKISVIKSNLNKEFCSTKFA